MFQSGGHSLDPPVKPGDDIIINRSIIPASTAFVIPESTAFVIPECFYRESTVSGCPIKAFGHDKNELLLAFTGQNQPGLACLRPAKY